MSIQVQQTHNPDCHSTREWIGPFPVTTTVHHPDCQNRVHDDLRTR